MYNKEYYTKYLSDLKANLAHSEASYMAATSKLDSLIQESALIEETKVALEQAKPLLSASFIKQLETLANTALSNIFHMDGAIEWDIESKRFVLRQGDLVTDLVDSNGGGLNSVVSLVFDLFLLVKQGCRRLLVYDEAFTAISDEFFPDFIAFLKQAIHDLDCDLLLVSHDVRIDPDMADTCYRIHEGKSIKIK